MDGATYKISSWLFARVLGVVQLIAFLSIGAQAHGLFGSSGVTPIALFVESATRARHGFFQHPSILWWWTSDGAISAVWVVGVLAAIALTLGLLPRVSLVVAWLAYLSFVSLGWPFMSYQWDTLLLEAAFTAFFFVPWRLWDRLDGHPDPHPVARWAMWWLLFRLVFRSGYVKLASGDATWTDLSALKFHYFTQPLPTPVAWYANLLPDWVQTLSCVLMFVVELGAPVLIWIPWAFARRTAAGSIAGLMAIIALTGNYGFFNLLAIALCLPLLDDDLLGSMAPHRFAPSAVIEPEATSSLRSGAGPALVIALTAVIFFQGTFGSGPPRWLGPLYPFGTFNNYGLFAVMTTERPEIEIEGTRDGKTWIPYVFPYKPGPLDRAPPWVAPHQPRLDWQMWFAALGDYRRNVWLGNLMRRMLEGETTVLDLIGPNPFADEPPKQVRAIIYRYELTTPKEREATGNWWTRRDRALYAPILGVPIDSAEIE